MSNKKPTEYKEVKNVFLTNMPTDNQLRSGSDYELEQKEARERHKMFQEQHKCLIKSNALVAKSHKAVITSMIFTGIIALATCISLYWTYPYRQHTEIAQMKLLQPEPTKAQRNNK